MGIKNLSKFLTKESKEAFENLPIDALSGQAIAIDVSIYMYKFMANALSTVCNQTNFLVDNLDRDLVLRLWINKTVNALVTWLSYNIKPILVFDGTPCKEKLETLTDRRKIKDDKREKIALLHHQIRNDPFLCHSSLINDYKKELAGLIEFSDDEKSLYKNVLKSLGFPCLQATGEAEQLCSMLCLDGYVCGVYTRDIDVLVYGCPLMIKDFSDDVNIDEHGFTTPLLKCVKMNKVLEELKVNQSFFVDLCIMSGCDYNTSIKNLGPARIFKMLKKYGSIENVPVDTTSYKYQFCREQFKTVPSESLIKEGDLEFKDPTNEYYKYTKFHVGKLRSYYQTMK